jgi:hypothetical protein
MERKEAADEPRYWFDCTVFGDLAQYARSGAATRTRSRAPVR